MRTILAVMVILLIGLTGTASLANPPTEEQPTTYENKGTASNQQKTDHLQPPSVLDFFSTKGLQNIANYCAAHPGSEPDKWLHEKFICDVHITDIATVIFTGLLVLVTGGLIVVGLKQWSDTKKEMRAYMGVARAFIRDWRTNDDPLTVQGEIDIKNTGQTMAKEAEVWFKVAAVPVSPDFPLGERKGKSVLMPNGIWRFHERIRITSAGFTQKGSVFIWGRINYKDVFGESHWTTFRFFLDKPEPPHGWDVQHSDEGNDAT